jgi:hypothetical protein
MSRSNSVTTYLDLANRFYENEISERDLPTLVAQLPSINEVILKKLARHAEEIGLSEPRRSWSIASVADVAAGLIEYDLFLQSKAAWYLGRACNDWGTTQESRFCNQAC